MKCLSLLNLHVVPVSAWTLSRYSSFLLQSRNMHVRSIGNATITLGVIVNDMCASVLDRCRVNGVFKVYAVQIQAAAEPCDTVKVKIG